VSFERSVGGGSNVAPAAATTQAAPAPGKRTLTEGIASSEPGAPSSELRKVADQLRASGDRPGPMIPVTIDLLSLFSPQAPRQPSLPSKFKNAPYEDIKGEAFVKGPGDADEVDPNDVHQGQLGDCGLHAAMIAIARTNPQAIKDLIKENGDGSYDVTLYFNDHFWNSKSPHVINVKSTFPTDGKGNPLFSQRGDTGPKGPELWAMLIEKAFAMHAGGYDDAEGIWDKDALSLLSSGDVTEESVTKQSEKDMGKAITSKLSSGNFAVTANTSDSRWDEWTRSAADEKEIQKWGIVMVHAYTIVAVDESAKTINLKNPWGFQDLTGLPFAIFRKYFNTWSAAKVK
jgi:hypothetical protein